jgi:hypothetical protein
MKNWMIRYYIHKIQNSKLSSSRILLECEFIRILEEILPEKPDCFRILQEFPTICSSDKIPTGEVDE